MINLFTGAHFDFVSKRVRRSAFIFSGTLILIGIVMFFVKGFNLGIDFTGGTVLQYRFSDNVTIDQLRTLFRENELSGVSIQNFGDSNDEFLLRSSETEAVLAKRIINDFSSSAELRREETVGPSIGSNLRRQALWAVIFSWLGILIYVGWRFELKYAFGAIFSLIHDVLITLGAFALLGLELNITVMAALLTLIGYSINDTIVVFDRIREYVRAEKPRNDEQYISILNKAINSTLNRTLITSVTTLIVVTILYLFGGEVISNFAFALMLGVVIGTYSSIFVATPIMVELHFKLKMK